MGGQINAKRVSFFFQLFNEQHFLQDGDLRCWGGHASQKMGLEVRRQKEGGKEVRENTSFNSNSELSQVWKGVRQNPSPAPLLSRAYLH